MSLHPPLCWAKEWGRSGQVPFLPAERGGDGD